MPRIVILAGGREERELDGLARRHLERLPWPATLATVPAPRGPGGAARRSFARRMLARIPDDALVVALDERGAQWTSRELARRLEEWMVAGLPVVFVIGDAEGLPQEVLARAAVRWSLSKLTFPHALVRLLVAEQLFRAASILAGHPYHRERRA